MLNNTALMGGVSGFDWEISGGRLAGRARDS